MHLVPLLESPQYRDRVPDARFLDHDRLEPPFEGRVLFDVLPVFVDRRRADRTELSLRECGLEHVGGIHRTLRGPGPDERVQFVNEQNNLSGGVLHLFQEGFQALLELPPETCPRDERAHVERHDPLCFERLGDITLDDPLGDPLGDRGLADAGLPDEDGVVLGPPREHLKDPANLLVPPDHRVYFPLPGHVVQIAPVARKGLVLLFGVLVGDPLRSPDLLQHGEDRLRGHTLIAEELPRGSLPRRDDGQEQVLRAQVLIVKVVRLFLRRLDQPPECGGERLAGNAHAAHLRQTAEEIIHLDLEKARVHTELLQHRHDSPLRILDERGEHVLGLENLVPVTGSDLLRILQGLL